MRNDIRRILVVAAGVGLLALGVIGPANAVPTHPSATTTASAADIQPPPCTSCA